LPETAILKLDEIKGLMDSSQLINKIETGLVLYCEGQAVVPPVGFLHFDQPPGQDIQIPKMVDYALHTGDQA
jgi:ornithine cyclodeaminase/alanine dehydrogenase-like protein (mu-crystallin family)